MDKKDFTVQFNDEITIALEDIVTKSLIKTLNPERTIQINQDKKEPPIIDYYFDGLIIETSDNSKVSDILISSDKYKLQSGLKVGDSLKTVLKRYEDTIPDTKNSNEEFYVLLYTYNLTAKDTWKEPKYYLIIRFKNEIVYDIELIFWDW